MFLDTLPGGTFERFGGHVTYTHPRRAAVTSRALADAFARGAQFAYLQSSALGESVPAYQPPQ